MGFFHDRDLKCDRLEQLHAGLVPARAIVGTADQYIPFAGYAHGFLSKVPGMVAALSLLGTMLLLYLLLEMLEEPTGPVSTQARDPIWQ